MKKDFRLVLFASADLKDALGEVEGRAAIDFVLRPELSTLPAVVITSIGAVRSYNQGGISTQQMQKMQIDIFAASYKAMDEVHILLRAHLETFSGTQGSTYFQRIFENAERDLPVQEMPDGSRVYHRAVDYIIHYQ